jgi:hypothetical protein
MAPANPYMSEFIGEPLRFRSFTVDVVEHPRGCYDDSRFPSRQARLEDLMSVVQPVACTS